MAKKRMINGEVPVNEVRQVGEGARGELPPARRASSPAAAEETGNAGNVQDEQSWPVGVKGPIGVEQVRQAALTLQEYKQGKKALNEKIINNEQWYRLHNQGDGTEMTLNNAPDSAWLFNSLANKHADAMDNYPEPNVLPRAKDDTETAKQLSAILPVVLEQNRYEQVYNDTWWYKIKHGTGCKMVVWDGSKAGGLGDIDIRIVDLLNLYWEPGVTDLQASRNLFHVEMVDDEMLLERWPWAQGHTGGAEQVPKYLYDDQVRTDGKSFVVDWYYKKSGRLHYCKFVNDCVLYASENDPDYAARGYYDHGKYPFVMDVMFPMAGSPAGFGYIELMKGTQYSIDVLGAAITRNADAASRVRYFVNSGSGLNESEFTDLDKSIDIQKYQHPENIYNGEIGKIGGVRFVQTTEAKIWKGTADHCADGVAVFGTLFIAANAYGKTSVNGGGLETIVKQKGSGGTSDPLDQRSTIGWKAVKTAEILTEEYMIRVESGSSWNAAAQAN